MPKRSKEKTAPPPHRPTGAGSISRLPWVATLLSLAVVLSSTVAVLPIRDARTHEAVPEAHLVQSPAYVLMAPVSNVLDTLTLVSRRQHIALLLGAIVLLVAWRAVVAVVVRPTLRAHGMAVLGFIVAVVAAYGAAALMPRPMAGLQTDDASIVTIDFHSHTSASHDGRGGFTAEKSRAWHADAGFDVAYVTDHATVRQAEEGIAGNPSPAADGTTLLQGIETGWNGEHVGVLGAERVYKGLLTPDMANLDTGAFRLASTVPSREPVIIWNHPHGLTQLPVADSLHAGVRAIEISNGDPSAMDRMRALHDSIDHFADRYNLALTTGTDNHGWGRTAPNWTLMQLPGWRALDGNQLETAIEGALRSGRYGITRAVERVAAAPRSTTALVLSAVTVPWTMFTTLSADERIAWLAWIWVVAGVAWWVRRRHAAA